MVREGKRERELITSPLPHYDMVYFHLLFLPTYPSFLPPSLPSIHTPCLRPRPEIVHLSSITSHGHGTRRNHGNFPSLVSDDPGTIVPGYASDMDGRSGSGGSIFHDIQDSGK